MTVSAICFFPLDVANAGASIDCTTGDKQCGGFNFTAIWYSLFGIIVVLLVVVVPFTIFFYETMDIEQPPLCKRLQTAFGYTITVVVVVAALTWIFCMIVNKAYIAITEFEVTAANSFLVSESEVPSLISRRRVGVRPSSGCDDGDERDGAVYRGDACSRQHIRHSGNVRDQSDMVRADADIVLRGGVAVLRGVRRHRRDRTAL